MSPAKKKTAKKKATRKRATRKAPARKKAAKKKATKKKAVKKKSAKKKPAKKKPARKKAPARAAKKKVAKKKAPARAAAKAKAAPARKKAATAKGKAPRKRAIPKPPPVPPPDAHPKLGIKHTCFACEAKFYDLFRPEPLCPKCGADQREAPKAVARPKPGAARKRPSRRSMAPLLEEEEEEPVFEDSDTSGLNLEAAGVELDDPVAESEDEAEP